ncbi:hypothetical protein JW851_03720 [Candidatus Woesearchaeota archaeon]|nr:hypothetical protein [Candidatus Woesearchaeota archaeon]
MKCFALLGVLAILFISACSSTEAVQPSELVEDMTVKEFLTALEQNPYSWTGIAGLKIYPIEIKKMDNGYVVEGVGGHSAAGIMIPKSVVLNDRWIVCNKNYSKNISQEINDICESVNLYDVICNSATYCRTVFPDDIISKEEFQRLTENTLSSSTCQFLIAKESVIEGTIIAKKFIGYCSGGGCEGKNYWGIKTLDNCLFYLDSESSIGKTKTINDTVRVLGIIIKQMDAHGSNYFHPVINPIKEVGSDFAIEPKEREECGDIICPEGKTLNVIKRYTGGMKDGCSFEWECV